VRGWVVGGCLSGWMGCEWVDVWVRGWVVSGCLSGWMGCEWVDVWVRGWVVGGCLGGWVDNMVRTSHLPVNARSHLAGHTIQLVISL